MKKITLTLFASTLFMSLHANPTYWLTYYIYSETDYVQGPWSRGDILKRSDYKYLSPHIFEDLFGSNDNDLIEKFISRLREKKPMLYNWDYDLKVTNDTVTISSVEKIKELETIKNEITATLTLNNFKNVIFDFENKEETWTIDNLTLPYFDLVAPKKVLIEEKKNANIKNTGEALREQSNSMKKGDNPKSYNPILIAILCFSIILNFRWLLQFFKNRKI